MTPRRDVTLLVIAIATGTLGCPSHWGPTGKEPRKVDCGASMGGERYQRPCEDQFTASSANVKLKGSYLQDASVEIGVSKDKLIEVTNETVNAVTWLRDLCADWNSCAISIVDYQERKKAYLALEDNFYAIWAKAKGAKETTATKGAPGTEVRDLNVLIDAQKTAYSRAEVTAPRH